MSTPRLSEADDTPTPSAGLHDRLLAEGMQQLAAEATETWRSRAPRADMEVNARWNQFLDTIGPQWTNFINRSP